MFDFLEERYQEEIDYCEFVNWKQTIPQIGSKNAAKSIFESVVKQLNEFAMPNVIKKQEEQMNLSLYYHAIEIDFEVARSIEKVNFLFVMFKFYNLIIESRSDLYRIRHIMSMIGCSKFYFNVTLAGLIEEFFHIQLAKYRSITFIICYWIIDIRAK